VERAIWVSSAFCCVTYFFFGLLLAAAYPALNSDNVLQEMLRDPATPLAARIAVYVFDLFTILPGILVYCIATRYNLVNSGFCTKHDAFWIGVVAPFAVSWLLMNDAYFSGLFTWSSLFFSLMCNFIAPIGVYILACKKLPPLQRNLQGKRGKVLFSPHLRRNVQGARDQATSADQVRRSLLQWLRSTLQEEAQTGEVDPQLLHLLLSPSTVPELDAPSAPALSGDALHADLSPFGRDLLSDSLLSHPRCAWLHEEAATAAVAAAALQMRDGGFPTLAAYSVQPSAELRLRSGSPPSSEEGNRASLGSSPQAPSRASSALLSGRTTPVSLWVETGSVAASRSVSHSRATPVSRLHACLPSRHAANVQGRVEQRGETQDDLRNGAVEDVRHETQAETGGAIRGGWASEGRVSPLSPLSPLSQRPSLRRLSSQIRTPPTSRGPAARSTRDKLAVFSRASSPWSVRSPERRAARDAAGQRTLEEVDQRLRRHLVAQANEAAATQRDGEEARVGIGSEASRTASWATFSRERSRKQSLASELFWSPQRRSTRPTFSPLSERRESLERLSPDTLHELQTVSAPGAPRSRRPSIHFAHRVLRGTGSTLFRLLSEDGAKREASSRDEDSVVISGFPTLNPGPTALGSTGLARRVRELEEPEVAACVTRDVDDDAAAIRAQLELPKLLLQHADEVERNVWLMPFGDEDLAPRGRARRQSLSATGEARLDAGWSEEAEGTSRRGRPPKASDGVRLRPEDGEDLRYAAGSSTCGEADRRDSVGSSAAREGSGNSVSARASVAKKTRFPDEDPGALRAPEGPSDARETYRERITVARTTETPAVGTGSSVPTQGPQVPRETRGPEETREQELFAPEESQVSPASGAFEATSRDPGIGLSTPAWRRGFEAPSPPQETRESKLGDSRPWGVGSHLDSPARSRETVFGSLQGPSSGVSPRGPSPQSRPRLRSARSHCVAPEAPSEAAVRRAQSCFLEAQSGGPPRPFAHYRLGREGEDFHASFLRGASWRDRVYARGCLGRRGTRLASGPGTASLLLPQDNAVETLGIGKRGRDILLQQQEQWIQQRLALLSHTSAPSPEGSLGLGSVGFGSQGGSRNRVSPVSPVSLQRQSLSRSLSSPSPLSDFSEAFLAVEGLEAPLLLRQLKERRKAGVEAEKERRKPSFAATLATFAARPFLARGLTLGDPLGDMRGETYDRRDTVRDTLEGRALLRRSVSVHEPAKPSSSPWEGERRGFKRGFSARQICVKTPGRVERLAAVFNRETGLEKRETPVVREAATELEEGDSDGSEQTPGDSSSGRCDSRNGSFLEGERSSRVSSCSLFSSPRETVEDARDAEFSRSRVSPDSRADSSVSEDAFALPGDSSFSYPSSLFYSPRSSRTEASPAKALPSVCPLAAPFQDRTSDSAASSAFFSCSSCSPGETQEASHRTKDSEATVRGALNDGDTLMSSPVSYPNGSASLVEGEGPRRTAARQAGGQGALEPHGKQALARGQSRWSGEQTTQEREGCLSPRVASEARDVETSSGETLKISEAERGETTVKFSVAETEKRETPSVVAPRDIRRLDILSPATSLSSRQVSPPRGSSEGPQGRTQGLDAEPFSWDESSASVSAPAAAPPKASHRLYRTLAGQDWQTKQAPLLAQCHREEANRKDGSEVEMRDDESGERVARPQSGNRVRYALETQGEASGEEHRPREEARSERMRLCFDETKKPGETAEKPKPFVQRRRGKPKTLCVKAWGPARGKTDASDEAHEDRDEDRDGPGSDKREEGQDSKGSRDVYSSLPTIQVTFADDQEVSGYEDALAVDEDFLTGDLLPIKIHVYPTAFLRNIHIELSVLILTSLLLCAFASLLYQVVWGEGN
ncbi:putative transmembrane protein, partial [Toxoplasma gondii GAB2-2007-GAL-DOM2]